MPQGHLAKYAFKPKQEEVPMIDLRKASSYNIPELNKLRRKLAKRANQRLLRLEREGMTDAYAYSQTMLYLYNNNRTRFYEGTRNLSITELKSELEELSAFLGAKSSTVGGIREIRRSTAQHFREQFGIEINDVDDFYKFLSSETYQHLVRMNEPSEFLIEFYDRAVEKGVKKKDIEKALQDFEKGKIEGWDELYDRVGMNFIDYI